MIAVLAQDVLRQKPASGAVFAFRGRQGDHLYQNLHHAVGHYRIGFRSPTTSLEKNAKVSYIFFCPF